ncbi:MAG: hypothetical protein ACOYT4_02300 [Nanoarchaeota archaeon]
MVYKIELIDYSANHRHNYILKNKTGNDMLDSYALALAHSMNRWWNANPNTNQLNHLYEEADLFLQNHSKVNFEYLLQEFEKAEENFQNKEYQILTLPLKKRLFRYRVTIYLSALYSLEQKEPIDLYQYMTNIEESEISPIKRERLEPTWKFLKDYLA